MRVRRANPRARTPFKRLCLTFQLRLEPSKHGPGFVYKDQGRAGGRLKEVLLHATLLLRNRQPEKGLG
ncbi:MAG: hypothetical protein NTV46_16975, partial [Verrucomicrobia bacterium]|nr:hypothetical protein [Verrucomicrobiota bacterium]